MRALVILSLLVVAGCTNTASSTARVGTATSEQAMLTPGPAYVAGFPESERLAVCDRLKYVPGTAEFERCMQGYFPENPAYAQASR